MTRFFFLFSLTILCAVTSASAVNISSEGEVTSFEDFISGFDSDLQARGRAIWERIEQEDIPKVSSKKKEEGISDEDLFASISVEDKEEFVAELGELRAQLAAAMAEESQTKQLSIQWRIFSDRTRGEPEMHAVHQGALKTANQYQTLLPDFKKKIKSIEKEIQLLREGVSLKQVSLNFTRGDWIVIAGYLVFTTILGGLLAGKQASMKDFFLGGRKLAWPAVCGSIIATELSAATFLIAPALVFSKGGDMTYIQLALGTILARFVIGYFIIPVYYKREIYSPYDYMGNQLGPRVKNITTILFMIGGILAQGARVYIAAKALQVITGTNVTTSIIIIGVVSIGWTIMGGITTVIWTDAIQFVLFTFGAIVAIVFAATTIDGGLGAILAEASEAGKLRAINLSFNPKEAYTLWCGLIGFSFLTMASHGTDQLLVQRMFTCKDERSARKAIIFSSFSQLLTYLLLFVGAGVFVYYKHFPLTAPEQTIVDADSMKIFAIYIVNVMPPLLSGLLMAAIFATAISTLDSLLAALSQSTVSIIYKPYIRPEGSDEHYVKASRVIVLIWGVLLTGCAIYCDVLARSYADLIQFALAMAAYTYGALLGVFLLAFLPTKRDDFGLMWGVPLSMLLVFGLNWHQRVPQLIVLIACIILIIQAFRLIKNDMLKILYVGAGVLIVLIINMTSTEILGDGRRLYIMLAWPWHFPIGTAMTFIVGYLVGNKTSERKSSNIIHEN
jgi:SSS family transporter